MRGTRRPVRFVLDLIPELEADVSDPFAGAPGAGQPAADQPSEEEVRAYLSQLREAPVEQVIAEVLSALLNAAQVKLGRSDGRLLLDVAAGVVDEGREQLPDELTDQVDDVLAQLRVAQVDAEQELAGAAAGGQEPAGEPAAAPEAGAAPPPSAGPSDPSSRLWVPGR